MPLDPAILEALLTQAGPVGGPLLVVAYLHLMVRPQVERLWTGVIALAEQVDGVDAQRLRQARDNGLTVDDIQSTPTDTSETGS